MATAQLLSAVPHPALAAALPAALLPLRSMFRAAAALRLDAALDGARRDSSLSDADAGADADASDAADSSTTKSLHGVSGVVGPLFEVEARDAIRHCLSETCPWASSQSDFTTRFELRFETEARQADIFC